MTNTLTAKAAAPMTYDEAYDIFISRVDAEGGKKYAQMVGRYQEGFLSQKVCADLDDAFTKAVDTTERLWAAVQAGRS